MRKFVVLLLILLAAACGQAAVPTATPAAQIDLKIDPAPPAMGTATLVVTVTKDGAPLGKVKVAARGDMNHAGMRPSLGDGITDDQGQVSIPFDWTMAGDWTVTITVTLADGSDVSQDFPVTVNP